MKRIALSLITIMMLVSACATTNAVDTKTETTTVLETTKENKVNKEEINTENEGSKTESNVKETITRQNRRASFNFDPSKKFEYTGEEKYLKEVTEAMLKEFGSFFDQNTNVEIPTPYIVKIDDEDIKDIKVYGDFYIYGYKMNGMIFDCVNGGSFPGCIHLRSDFGNISFVSVEVAEDGSNNAESLLKICGGDESLKKDIYTERDNDGDKLRIEYVKMYAKDNDLLVAGIKDYGWPVILFDDISDARFVYNFYDSYLQEIRADNSLNDFEDRMTNLKKKYLTPELMKKLSDLYDQTECDKIVGDQDATEMIMDTMQVEDMGDGNLIVSCNIDKDTKYVINVKLETINGKKKFVDMIFEK